jgi:type IV pilus assembly protein PilA
MLMFIKKMKKNRKGYTLTELIVVVAILGILAAVATPMVMGQISKANTSADLANAKSIESAIAICVANETLAEPLTIANIKTAVEADIGDIPATKITTDAFYVTLATGKVSILTATTVDTDDVKKLVH